MLEWWATTLISAVVAGAVLASIFGNKNWPGAKVVLCMVPFARTAVYYIVTADAVRLDTTERMRRWLLGQIAFSGICQDWSIWMMYVSKPEICGLKYPQAPAQNTVKQCCSKAFVFQYLVPFATFAALDAATYWFIREVPQGLYIAAGIGTVANICFFMIVVRKVVDDTPELLNQNSHEGEDVGAQAATVFFVTIAYLFGISAALQQSGPLLSNAVAAVPYVSFVVVPLSGASMQTQRRKIIGILWGIAFNNNFLSWIFYGFSFTPLNWWQPAATLAIGFGASVLVVPCFRTKESYEQVLHNLFTATKRPTVQLELNTLKL
mgnify:CR=1 FL=1